MLLRSLRNIRLRAGVWPGSHPSTDTEGPHASYYNGLRSPKLTRDLVLEPQFIRKGEKNKA